MQKDRFMQAVVITCQRRDLDHLLDAFEDWTNDGDAKIVLYGYTNKQQDGFIVLHWTQPITETFHQKQLKADPGIIDYVIYDLPSPQPVHTTL